MNSTASIAPKLVTVSSHTVRSDVGREFLEIQAPDGWGDVQKLVARVLVYDDRNFTYTGWNSDRNVAYFSRSLVGNDVYTFAKIL